MDPDEGRMRSAAHLMVCSLAGSLALVTCKDPLRIALSQQLHSLVQSAAAGMDKAMLDQVVQVVVQVCFVAEPHALSHGACSLSARLLLAGQPGGLLSGV